jgi:hypothetical protein
MKKADLYETAAMKNYCQLGNGFKIILPINKFLSGLLASHVSLPDQMYENRLEESVLYHLLIN